uniref:Ig-like domain-containing protein n=1 Tax=Salarias fasciatus TaxID=181472 RepID=A0A672FQ03_SALFA
MKSRNDVASYSLFHCILCSCKMKPRIVSPNITLYPVWKGKLGNSAVRLICTLSGFYPDKLSVEWQHDQQPLNIVPNELKLQSMEGREKTFSLSSEIEPNITEWTTGSSFTCKATHEGSEYEKTTSICESKYECELLH